MYIGLKFLQLIERGKVDVTDVASEIGIPPDSLASMLDVILNYDTFQFQ